MNAKTIEATLIRFDGEYALKGFEILLHSGQCMALPNDTYLVGEEHLALLKNAGIQYRVLAG